MSQNWPCGNCGETAYAKTWSGDGWEYCDRCGDIQVDGVPDVYWDGGPEHGLADDPRTGQPRVFGSKSEKSRYLKANNLVEAGDKIRGGPLSASIPIQTHDNPREVAAQALAHVKQMGAAYRRQEYQRILKESGRI